MEPGVLVACPDLCGVGERRVPQAAGALGHVSTPRVPSVCHAPDPVQRVPRLFSVTHAERSRSGADTGRLRRGTWWHRCVSSSLVWWLRVLCASAAPGCYWWIFPVPAIHLSPRGATKWGSVLCLCSSHSCFVSSGRGKTMTSWFPHSSLSCVIAEKRPFTAEQFLSSAAFSVKNTLVCSADY